MSHRLFTAIRPPFAVRAALTAIMGGVEGARWQSDDQLHLTLRFIGAVDRNVAEDVAVALTAVRQPCFALAIAGAGQFERRGRAEALWAGLAPNPALHALHRKIDHALITAGLEAEHRAFLPHITLARFGRPGGDAGLFLARHAGLTLPPWTAESFGLFESHLGGEGARYEKIMTYALRQ